MQAAEKNEDLAKSSPVCVIFSQYACFAAALSLIQHTLSHGSLPFSHRGPAIPVVARHIKDIGENERCEFPDPYAPIIHSDDMRGSFDASQKE